MTIITHNGKFHADDVFAVAALLLFLKGKKVEVVRTRDEVKFKDADFVVDVGGEYNPEKGRFDHHQPEGAGSRSNGVSYASFGLVWKEYGEEICKDKAVASHMDRRLVQDIDAIDNGMEIYHTGIKDVIPYTVGDVIEGFAPTWQSVPNFDEAFNEALLFAKEVLKREVERQRENHEGYKLARKAYELSPDKRIIELNAMHPWSRELTRYPEPLYVICPYAEGKWQVRAVPVYPKEFKVRKPLPSAWLGLDGEHLQEISGVREALFVHRNGFMGISSTKDGAIELAKKAIEINNG